MSGFATAPPVEKSSGEPSGNLHTVAANTAEGIGARRDCPMGTRAPMRGRIDYHGAGHAELDECRCNGNSFAGKAGSTSEIEIQLPAIEYELFEIQSA